VALWHHFTRGGLVVLQGEGTDKRYDGEPPAKHAKEDAESAVKCELLEKNPATSQEKFKPPSGSGT